MSRTNHVLAAVLATVACAAQAQVTRAAQPPSNPPVVAITAAPSTSSAEMQRLMASAQQLRDSIQALSQKTPGPERDLAIAKAQEALLKTQRAMLDLPPEYRTRTATLAPSGGYDPSVQALMNAAESLRKSIQAMAREPAGERRNQAIREANRALLDTQVAMANAYDVTAFPPHTATLGAGPATMQCTWLGTMWGCR